MPPKRHLKLTSVKHVRRLLATTINQVINDELSSETARTLAHLCTVLLKTLELSNLEERITKLEEALEIEKPFKEVTSDVKKQIADLRS
ncbi:MAG: hypothetical protein ACREOW_10500 [Thermodesulfobacteriota bacterium]